MNPGQGSPIAGTLPGVKVPNSDLPSASSTAQNPGSSTVAGNLPDAKTPSTDTPESFNPFLESPTTGAVAGDLPLATIGSHELVDASKAAPNPNPLTLTTELPVALVKGNEKAESGMQLQADPPVVSTNLPETKVGATDKPEVPSPTAFADSVLLTILPSDFRPPKIPGATTADPSSVARTAPTGTATGDLKDPQTRGTETADAANAGPGSPVSAVTSALKEPNANGADASANQTAPNGVVAINPNEAKIPGRPDSAPFLPGQSDAAIANNLKDPRPIGTADASSVAKNPGSGKNPALVGPGVQNPDTLPGTKTPGTVATVPTTLVDAHPKATTGPTIVYVPTATPGPNKIDPRVQQILG